MPELLPDNESIFTCIALCDSQCRAGVGGVYALDWAVILRAADDMGIETDMMFYQLVRAYEATMVREVNARSGGSNG
jgi:hypothetical protein